MIIVDYKPEHARDILAGEMNKGAPKHIGQFRNFADNLNWNSVYCPGQWVFDSVCWDYTFMEWGR